MKNVYQYKVKVSRDTETGHIVAQVPALGIGDWGSDVDEALKNIQEMTAFHIECLIEEGKPVAQEDKSEEGVPG